MNRPFSEPRCTTFTVQPDDKPEEWVPAPTPHVAFPMGLISANFCFALLCFGIAIHSIASFALTIISVAVKCLHNTSCANEVLNSRGAFWIRTDRHLEQELRSA